MPATQHLAGSDNSAFGGLTIRNKSSGYLENDIMKNFENWIKGIAPYSGMVKILRTGRVKFAQGEHWGKAISAGSLYYRYTRDPELKEILEATVADLLTTVRGNGSITASAVSDQPEHKGGRYFWQKISFYF